MDDATILENTRAEVAALLEKDGDGFAAASRMGAGVREVVRRAWASERLDEVGLSLVAQGGLARDEQCPRADVDLLVIVPPGDAQERVHAGVEAFLRRLWDAGMRLGHAVRTPAELEDAIRQDHHAATALLEATPLAGDLVVAADVLGHLRRDVLPPLRRELVGEKLDEMAARRERFGNHVHLVEPNVKSSPGGTRDVHTLIWVGLLTRPVDPKDNVLRRLLSMGLLFEREERELRDAWRTLVGIRAALHLVTDRAEDRLLFEHQQPVALTLGFEETNDATPAERMMRAYFQAALRVRRSVDGALERMQDAWRRWPLLGRRAEFPEAGLFARGGRLYVNSPGLFAREPARMVDAVRVAAENDLALAPRTRSQIRETVEQIPQDALWDDAEVGAALLRLCRATQVTGTPFTTLLEMGVMGLVMRDFARLEGRFKADGYHAYTTDAHICHACDLALRAVSGALPVPKGLAPAKERATDLHLFVLGALFHDIGKGLAGDHSALGVEIVRREARRFGLTAKERRTLAFLVREHLVLSHASQRRDLGDPLVIEELATEVRTTARLYLLALLTWIDIRAVAPAMFTDWKGQLLGQAVERTEAWLMDPDARANLVAEDEADARQYAREELAGRAPAAVVEEFISGASVRYLVSRQEDSLGRDLDAFAAWRAGDGQPVVRAALAESGRAHTIRVVVRDRQRLLADLAAGLASEGADVLHAMVVSRRDGVAVDAFRVDNGRGDALPAGELAHVVRAVEAAAIGDVPRRSAGRRAERGPPLQPRVRMIEDGDSWGATLLEVRTRDRTGLLADLTAVIAGAGWDVLLALISTDGSLVRDTFYVRPLEGHTEATDLCRALLAVLDERAPDPPAVVEPATAG